MAKGIVQAAALAALPLLGALSDARAETNCGLIYYPRQALWHMEMTEGDGRRMQCMVRITERLNLSGNCTETLRDTPDGPILQDRFSLRGRLFEPTACTATGWAEIQADLTDEVLGYNLTVHFSGAVTGRPSMADGLAVPADPLGSGPALLRLVRA
ncbi:MAG: hypothetical protein KDK12_04585 [Rhodobacteraceae bacterium]|nr:hypothetical protein [Paracoccaceae bacterium]